jgi:hypothetical protein
VTEFIASLEDSAWKTINEQFDNDYTAQLSAQLEKSLQGNNPFQFILEWISPKYKILHSLNNSPDFEEIQSQIEQLSDQQQPKVYTAVLSKYQSMNFVSSSDYESYKRKLFYKKALILLAPSTQDAERLLQSTAYDLEDIIQSKSLTGISETL